MEGIKLVANKQERLNGFNVESSRMRDDDVIMTSDDRMSTTDICGTYVRLLCDDIVCTRPGLGDSKIGSSQSRDVGNGKQYIGNSQMFSATVCLKMCIFYVLKSREAHF